MTESFQNQGGKKIVTRQRMKNYKNMEGEKEVC